MTMLAFHTLAVVALQVAPVAPATRTVPLTPPRPAVAAGPVVAQAALAGVAMAPARTLASVPPDSWATQDPADSLYRAARATLNRGEYRRAAEMFRAIPQRYSRSTYAGDAFYWQAFALYRIGGTEDLRAARRSLEEQGRRFPRSSTRENGDARTLSARIDGELAQRGDSEAAARVRVTAQGPQGAGPSSQPPAQQAPRQSRSGDDDDDPRIAAINALMQMDPEDALPILKKVLARRDDASVGLRRKAVFIVSQKRSTETEDILMDAVRNDPDKEVREQAVFWLSQVPSERTVVLLDSLLRTSNDRDIQEKALFSLSQHQSPRAAEALRAYAGRSDAPVELREKAIFWLGQQRRNPENAAFLRDLYGRVTERELKEKIIFSLSQMKSEENARWLLDIARDERQDIETRKHALFWAGQGGAPIADLVAIYDRMPDREMKEQLIFVYSQRRDAAAVDKLFDIAKNDRDPELRKKAIFWIGQSKDPRARQFLDDIINQP